MAYQYTSHGGNGGAGGAWGTAGGNGTNGTDIASPAQNGGAPGYAALGNANITWTSVGTRIGPVA